MSTADNVLRARLAKLENLFQRAGSAGETEGSIDGCALARSIGAEKPINFTFTNSKVDVAQDWRFANGKTQVLEFYKHGKTPLKRAETLGLMNSRPVFELKGQTDRLRGSQEVWG